MTSYRKVYSLIIASQWFQSERVLLNTVLLLVRSQQSEPNVHVKSRRFLSVRLACTHVLDRLLHQSTCSQGICTPKQQRLTGFPIFSCFFFCTKISVLLRNFLLSFRWQNRCKLWRCWIRQKAAALSWTFSVRSSITHHKLPNLKFICYFACLRLFRESNGRSSAPRRSQVSLIDISQNYYETFYAFYLWKFTTCFIFSGTEKQAVADDYARRLAWGNAAAQVTFIHPKFFIWLVRE